MNKYHTVSAAFDREAGIKEIAGQLAKLLGTGAGALSDAIAAIRKIGVDAATKLMNALRNSLSGLNQGTRSRFARAILTVAIASGALMAQGCVAGMTVKVGGDVSYREYRRRPHVVHVRRAGLPERDIRRIYVHLRVGDRRQDRQPRRYTRSTDPKYTPRPRRR